ncbi:MAG: hypothetical protein ACOY81_07290, partial [Bacillota bacterium]
MLFTKCRPATFLLVFICFILLAGCTLPWQKKTPEKQAAPANQNETAPAAAPAKTVRPAVAAAAATALPRPKPAATVLEPLPAVTAQQQLEVRGKTKPGLQVFINNLPVPVEANGTFTTLLELKPGTNQLQINTLGKAGFKEEHK